MELTKIESIIETSRVTGRQNIGRLRHSPRLGIRRQWVFAVHGTIIANLETAVYGSVNW